MPSSSSSQPAEYLRRYTDLPALLYMLRRKKLSLLSPDSWDDKNDSHFIELYRERRALPTVLPLCFTEKGETYHHWRVFSSGSGGICIKFHRVALLEHLSKFKGVRFGVAKYAMMDRLRNQPPALDDLPFLKRYAFRDEDEFRVIYEGMKTKRETKDFPLPFSCIAKISISPWAPELLGIAITETIKGIPGCEQLQVGRSSLINNKEWKRIGANAA
jgi:hypothetical protein